MNNYAKVPAKKPENSAIYQLPAVSVGGSKFYGWKMVYFKSVDTGKRDKNGKEIIKSVPDKARPVTYDPKTEQLQNQKVSKSTIGKLVVNSAKQSEMIAKLTMQIAMLKKGANK